ncbi:MAG: YihA family ribosome biosis GTP-binding protein [Candidatus Parcubacteria bacterium]|jgi:GTP-binding protein
MKITSAEFKKGIRGTDDILYEEKPQIAFMGRSNVGKSSLINCILNKKDLVKSGKKPGKTKEINFFLINNAFYCVDLPGYGFAQMSPEERDQIAGMLQWYLLEDVFKRKVILVLDIRVGPSVMDEETLRLLRERGQDALILLNKADALNQSERSTQIKKISELMPAAEMILCSAKTKEGRGEILKKISDFISESV